MEDKDNNNGFSIDEILIRIQSLEDRLTKLESGILYGGSMQTEPALETSLKKSPETADQIAKDKSEGFWVSNVGKYGLGWLANIVFIFGIAYLMSYFKSTGQTVLPIVLGFVGVLGMFAFSYLLKNAYQYVSFLIHTSAILLLFYVTSSLYFFSSTPILSSKVVVIILLIVLTGGQMYFAHQRKIEGLGGIGVIMLLGAGILSNTTHMMLPLSCLAAASAVYLFIRYEWWRVFILSIFLVYFTHLLWLFNNPFMGNEIQTVEAHQHNLIYLIINCALFSLPVLYKHWKKISDSVFVSAILLNGLGFYLLAFFVVLSFYPENYAWIFAVMTFLFLVYSVALKIKSNFRYTPAFYACFGFIALSVAIYGYFGLPGSFFLLALESLLVLLMAIWFRSTIIVVVNVLMFFFLLIYYLATSEPVDSINLVFAFTALATARILNWKKERLALRTEHFRNFFLVAAFFMVLYALYHFVPSQYVTLSWTGVAGLYFLVSFVLRNVKYRLMGIATLIVTAFYLFLIDLKNMDLEYRIFSFIFLAVISLGASLYYTKRLAKKEK